MREYEKLLEIGKDESAGWRRLIIILGSSYLIIYYRGGGLINLRNESEFVVVKVGTVRYGTSDTRWQFIACWTGPACLFVCTNDFSNFCF